MWLPYGLSSVAGAPSFALAPKAAFSGTVSGGAWYTRALSTSEVVATWRHGV